MNRYIASFYRHEANKEPKWIESEIYKVAYVMADSLEEAGDIIRMNYPLFCFSITEDDNAQ